ncbi:hypothetical protein Ssed_1109 [Shewanella sediminis HAW-EB3]|uniref:HTH araC/xylS-type domain-containing protein n=1 Tax=Shewanella sediminis (strain HAW-EB3) TaxID=425104 RepID=A8FS97_SHESH|nr:hypothetical protein Ssed_1109 [Shewanella sediminis HAW-EB3]
MYELQHFLSSIAFSQMLICSLLLLPQWRENHSVRLFILLMLASSCYLLGEVLEPASLHSPLWWIELIGGNALPGLFWLVSLSVFGEHIVLRRWQYALASLTLVIPLSVKLLEITFSFKLNTSVAFNGFIHYGSLLLELMLISHALLIAAQQLRDDLVQNRRYIRGAVITLSAIYIFLVILIEQTFRVQWAGLDLLKGAGLALLMTGINFFLFRLRESSLFETEKPKEQPTEIQSKPPSKELEQILNAMTEDKLYQQEGITIATLAKHLCIHEYKLRHLINREMNFRNFNDFLNHYRIKEITGKLEQSEFNQTPVLTLALESGFRSLSSFNKVFKTTHQLTPTEYRKRAIANA